MVPPPIPIPPNIPDTRPMKKSSTKLSSDSCSNHKKGKYFSQPSFRNSMQQEGSRYSPITHSGCNRYAFVEIRKPRLKYTKELIKSKGRIIAIAVACASCSSTFRICIMEGTATMPPPAPKSPLHSPVAIPIANIFRI